MYVTIRVNIEISLSNGVGGLVKIPQVCQIELQSRGSRLSMDYLTNV